MTYKRTFDFKIPGSNEVAGFQELLMFVTTTLRQRYFGDEPGNPERHVSLVRCLGEIGFSPAETPTVLAYLQRTQAVSRLPHTLNGVILWRLNERNFRDVPTEELEVVWNKLQSDDKQKVEALKNKRLAGTKPVRSPDPMSVPSPAVSAESVETDFMKRVARKVNQLVTDLKAVTAERDALNTQLALQAAALSASENRLREAERQLEGRPTQEEVQQKFLDWIDEQVASAVPAS